jgi:hypothetical protein
MKFRILLMSEKEQEFRLEADSKEEAWIQVGKKLENQHDLLIWITAEPEEQQPGDYSSYEGLEE